MAKVNFAVMAMPIETITAEEATKSVDIAASEIGASLNGSGIANYMNNFGGTAAAQGYKDGIVNYISAGYTSGGSVLTTMKPDFLFIKNTGKKYVSATSLGVETTDCIIVAIKCNSYSDGVDDGWMTAGGNPEEHFFEIAWLKPGEAILLPLGANKLGITSIKDANDLSEMNDTDSTGVVSLIVKTLKSNGTVASSANAVNFLSVT